MKQQIAGYVDQAEDYAPWSREAPWYLVAAEGVIGALVGLYFIVWPDSASSTVRYLLAAILVGASAIDIYNGFRNSRLRGVPPSPMMPYWLIRGGAGVAVGLVAILAERSNDISDADARKLLGYGLLAYGVIGIIGMIDLLFNADFSWLGLLGNSLAILVGAALIYNNVEAVEGDKATRYVGYAALAGGLIVAAYSYFVKRGQEEDVVSAASPAAKTVEVTLPENLGTNVAPPSKLENLGANVAPPSKAVGDE